MRIKFLLLFFVMKFAAACNSAPTSPSKPILLVTLPPYQSLVSKIAGDGFEVRTVVPANADPHSYEPTSKQAIEITQGKIWFQIGEPFEKKLDSLIKNTERIDLRQNISLIEGSHCCHHTEYDRHIWLGPKELLIQAKQIASVLQQRFPQEQEQISQRFMELKKELSELDQQIEQKLTGANTTFVVSHPAFAYFCREYGCTQLSIEHEGKEARPQELTQLLQTAREENASVVLALPQHPSKGAYAMAKELKIPLKVINPYESDYSHTLLALADLLAPSPSDEE